MKFDHFSENRAKTIKGAAALALAAAVLAAAMPGSGAVAGQSADKPKSETVYAVLDNDGAYRSATIVNCFTQGGEITDYGEYLSVKNLSGPESPVIEGNKLTWPASASEAGDAFYYEGETTKQLPVSVHITYYLNGEETQAADIAGKTGELRIEFTLINNSSTGETDETTGREVYTPFAAQVSMALSNDMYTVLEMPDNGSCVLAGSSYTLSYASFPLPEDTFLFTVFGSEMELEPINIVMLPKSPPGLDSYGDFIDVDGMTEGADDMISGADDMRQGTGDLLDALKQMKDAAKQLKAGIDDLNSGAASLDDGAGKIYSNARVLKSSADDFYSGFSEFAAGMAQFDAVMGQLEEGVGDMSENLAQLASGAAAVDSGVDGVAAGVGGISASNSQLVMLAQSVAASYPGDMNAQQLAAGLAGQQTAIDSLASGCADLKTASSGLKTGMQDFYAGFSTDFMDRVGQLRLSSGALYTSCLELLSGADALDGGIGQLTGALRELSDGAGDLAGGLAKAADGLPDMISGIDEMIEGVEDLYDGIGKLNDDGLKQLKDEFGGLEGYLDKLSAAAQAYGSFMDERNAATSTVQFVLKTQGIKVVQQ